MNRSRRWLVALIGTLTSFVAYSAMPAGWNVTGSGPQDYTFDVDTIASDGRRSAVITAKPDAAPGKFGSFVQSFSAEDYRGSRVRMSAALRTQDALRAQLWLRVDGDNKLLAFDNMDSRPVVGSTDWKRYEIVLDVPQDAVSLVYGFFLFQKGKVWADDFRFERVPNSVPTTGSFRQQLKAPQNASFED